MRYYVGERMRNELGGLEDYESRKRTEAVSLPEVCCAGWSLASHQLFFNWISTTPDWHMSCLHWKQLQAGDPKLSVQWGEGWDGERRKLRKDFMYFQKQIGEREEKLPLLLWRVTAYGSLCENGPHRFICLRAWSPVRGTVWQGLGGVALLGKWVPGRGLQGFQSPHQGSPLPLTAAYRSGCKAHSHCSAPFLSASWHSGQGLAL